ncbi:homoserine O-succinyltransferase [Duganella sp. CT11-25]|uniref:homoserine O-acetyltransferase/O-succinyltransferase family protein n=1 Tax=unclassified Duganella TaxID=2636909 RepID=UPI0039AF7C0B
MQDTKLQIGLLNIMPKAHDYEPQLREALADVGDHFVFQPVRLETHQYLSSAGNIANYRTFDQVAAAGVDMLIITGAPVENLDFQDINYWPELSAIIARCVDAQVPLMGICFGGLALLHSLGVEKEVFAEKRFGVAELTPGDPGRARRYLDRPCHMAVATWALPRRSSLAPLLGDRLHSIAEHAEYGPLVLESHDNAMYIVLGHPEYRLQCLYDEWTRDKLRNFSHTRRFTEASFEQMAKLLGDRSTHLLSAWVRHWLANRPVVLQTGT